MRNYEIVNVYFLIDLRCQLMRSAALAAAAAASPPSATAPIGAACQPTPMDSSSEDSESDSSSTSSSSSSPSSSSADEHHNPHQRRRRSCSSHSSLSEYNGYIENNYMQNNLGDECIDGEAAPLAEAIAEQNHIDGGFERRQLLDDHMDDEDDVDEFDNADQAKSITAANLSPIVNRSSTENVSIQNAERVINDDNNKEIRNP